MSGLWSALVMLAQASGLSDPISDAAVAERLNSIARVLTRGAMELYSEPASAAITAQTGSVALQSVTLSVPATRSIAVLSVLIPAQCSPLTYLPALPACISLMPLGLWRRNRIRNADLCS